MTAARVPACVLSQLADRAALVGISRMQPTENGDMAQRHRWAELSSSAGRDEVRYSPGARCALVGSVSPQQGSLRTIKAAVTARLYQRTHLLSPVRRSLLHADEAGDHPLYTHTGEGPHTDTGSCPDTHSVTVC